MPEYRFIHWSVRDGEAWKEIDHVFTDLESHPSTFVDSNGKRSRILYNIRSFYGDLTPNYHHLQCAILAKQIVGNFNGKSISHEFGIHHSMFDFNGQIKINLFPPPPDRRLKWFMRDRLEYCLNAKKHLSEIPYIVDDREIKAREIAKRVLGNKKYVQYLQKNKLPIHSKSGKIYQLSGSSNHMPVFFQRKEIERVCLVAEGFCPTDLFLMRYLLLIDNEDEFNKLEAHRSPASKKLKDSICFDDISLPELFREIKHHPRIALGPEIKGYPIFSERHVLEVA